MLVIGVAIGSVAFPMTKTQTTTVPATNEGGYDYSYTTVTVATTQVSTVTQTVNLTLNSGNITLDGVCTVVSYLLPDIVQEVSTVVTNVYPNTTNTTNSFLGFLSNTQTLGSSTYSSTITAHNTTIYSMTTTRYNTLDISSWWSVTNCTFG